MLNDWKAAVGVIAVVAIAGITAFSNPTVQGELKAWTGAAPENPKTVYGYLPISTDSGLLDIPSLTLAGEAPSADTTAPKYRCYDNSYYIDQDGDRGVKYYSGDHISGDAGYYFYGYDKSYAYAEVCGGRYNYQCTMGGSCDGFVEDDPDGGDSGSGGADTNQPPEIQSIDTPSTVNTSTPFRVTVEASDPDSSSLTYSWSNGKNGDSINLNYEETGVKELEIQVSDGAGNTVSSTVQVRVVEPEQTEEPVTDPEQPDGVGFFQGLINWYFSLFS
jgi:hypothetical protein